MANPTFQQMLDGVREKAPDKFATKTSAKKAKEWVRKKYLRETR